MTAFNAIDLSQLPPPDLVEALDYETILAAMKAELLARAPELGDVLDLESEPAVKLLEVAAYRELLLRQRINDAARGVMLASATGADLDQLAALWGVTRRVLQEADDEALPPVPEVFEDEATLRYRTQLALEAYSTAGTVGGYTFWALSADGQVKDVSVTRPSPGDVLVTVLSTEGDGTAAAPLLAAVEAVVTSDEVRPLCDTVTVQSAEIVGYDIVAELRIEAGPDAAIVQASAQAAVEAYVASVHDLGAVASLSGIYRALHQPGVESAELTSPAADVEATALQAPLCGTITITPVEAS